MVTENRLSVDDFLGDATVDHMFIWRPELDAVLQPALYATPAAAVQAWFGLFFAGLAQPAGPDEVATASMAASAGWRAEATSALRQPASADEGRHGGLWRAGGCLRPQHARCVAHPGGPGAGPRCWCWLPGRCGGTQPLVTLRVQLWVRELRRMVGKLAVDPQQVQLRSERDLPGERDGV